MLAHSYKNTVHIVAPPTLTSGSIILHKVEYTLPKAASTQFTAFLLDYFFKKTFLRKTQTPHCGPNLTTLPKDVFIFQQSLQLSFKINVGEEFLKYFKIGSSLWPHHIPGVNVLNKPQSYLQTSNSMHMYIYICKFSTPNCGPFNSTIRDLNNCS